MTDSQIVTIDHEPDAADEMLAHVITQSATRESDRWTSTEAPWGAWRHHQRLFELHSQTPSGVQRGRATMHLLGYDFFKKGHLEVRRVIAMQMRTKLQQDAEALEAYEAMTRALEQEP